jgi:hypothetical protein
MHGNASNYLGSKDMWLAFWGSAFQTRAIGHSRNTPKAEITNHSKVQISIN